MAEPFLPPSIEPPDFYVAALGRSGSTLLCNWLSAPPERLVFVEPFFMRPANSRLLRIQLADFGLPVAAQDWARRAETAAERFARLMAPRLAGRRWALKEVVCEEHVRVLDALAPRKVLISVRNIGDVALSFFEKHRAQANLDRFSDEWVIRYCREESAGIVRFRDLLAEQQIPLHVVRYEDFTASAATREAIEHFVGWPGQGDTASHLAAFDRSFEVERHGSVISNAIRTRAERDLGPAELRLADQIARDCFEYQREFGYF